MKVFVSFDEQHDRDLYELFVQQSLRSGSSFEVVQDRSIAMRTKGWSDHPRADIRSADEVVFLCGEHTSESVRMSVELDIAREEEKPYLLVWGRRDRMCTKPDGALPDDGMYSWTRNILESQMATTLRGATPRVIPESYKRRPNRAKPASASPRSSPAAPDSSHDQRLRKQEDS